MIMTESEILRSCPSWPAISANKEGYYGYYVLEDVYADEPTYIDVNRVSRFRVGIDPDANCYIVAELANHIPAGHIVAKIEASRGRRAASTITEALEWLVNRHFIPDTTTLVFDTCTSCDEKLEPAWSFCPSCGGQSTYARASLLQRN